MARVPLNVNGKRHVIDADPTRKVSKPGSNSNSNCRLLKHVKCFLIVTICLYVS